MENAENKELQEQMETQENFICNISAAFKTLFIISGDQFSGFSGKIFLRY